MTILSWFLHSGATTQKSRRSAMRWPGTNFDRRRRPSPPRVELLEDRTLLSAPAPLTSVFSGSGGRLGYAQTAGSRSTFRGDTFDGKSSSGKITHNLLSLESKTAPSAGLVPTAGISPAAEVASHVSTGRLAQLAMIEELAKLAYIWGLPAEFVYRFSKYNQLVTAPPNTFAYNTVPAAWNNAATNAGNASVLYFYAQLDLTRTDLVYTIPPTNLDFQITQIIDNFTNVVSDPGTRTLPTNNTTSFLLVGPNSPYAHKTNVTLKGFTFPVIALDTNRGEMLLRLYADTLAPASSPNSVSNIFKNLGTQFTLNTLKQFQSNGNKPVPPASYNRMTPTPEQLARAAKWQNTPTNAVAFFKQMGQSLRLNPLPTRRTGLSGLPLSKLPSYIAPQSGANQRYFVPASGQQSTLALFRSIGLTPQGFTIPKSWGAAEIAALQKGFENGIAAIQATFPTPTSATNYWSYVNQGWGTYANNPTGYQYRAVGVIAGGFPNLPVDALYAASFTNNASLAPLDGNNTYSLTFLPQQQSDSSLPVTGILPPLALNSCDSPIGFWSITLYQPDTSQAAAPFISQASVLNTAYSQADTPVVAIDPSTNMITVQASNVGPLVKNTAIMFGAGASYYGLTPNVPYYIASTPTQSGGDFSFQISTQWKQNLSANDVPIQSSGGPQGIVQLTTPLNPSQPLDYGVIQPVSQLGLAQIEDGSLQPNNGSQPGYPAGTYTIWLSPTLPPGVPATNWIPTPSTAYLDPIYAPDPDDPQLKVTSTYIEPIIRMYYAQPGNDPPSILPLPPDGNYPNGLPSSYLFPPLVLVS
jgi:hypothetical protein